MFAIATPPAKQSVSETITTLSGRLNSSTLLEDRRAAILGLRSFAKEYPASVASDALRGLIGSLSNDREDVDTVKITLETLLMLFNPNESSPEASEEIALWLADEFTQRQDNITLLLDFLDTQDFYSRLYSLQLLSAILASRAERTEECIFIAPLGISRLVAVLDDRREAVRNEALSLLTYLTPNSTELQKRVAFEDAFDRIFNIIKLEGSLVHGDRIVEDCLIFLANLLRLNNSNQSFFREAGCVPKVSWLLKDAGKVSGEDDIAEWAKTQRNRNIYALLAVLRLFLVTGGVGTQTNQASFWQHGVLDQVLHLAFSRSTEMQIKAEALTTCADLIRGNPALQEGFSQFKVTSVLDEPSDDGKKIGSSDGIPQVYVIDGLLDLTLSVPLMSAFDSRLAACECIKSYFFNHPVIRKHFLHRAIDGHTAGADETANVITTLLQPLDSQASSDPYRYWFAAVILFHLVYEDANAKSLVMSITEGDAAQGEEVVTCLQTLTGNLVVGIQRNLDERVLVAYLMLLCGWLFEDPDGVNDFLGEGSNLQSLVQGVSSSAGDGVMVQGLCAILLGIVYDFSTKDSPVARATIHPIIASQMGREKYIDRLTKLRAYPLFRDFEVLPQRLSSAQPGGLPEVFFDTTFVDFIKDNFSRLLRVIDRDPGMEIPVVANGVQKGISREMVDSLRSQLDEKEKALQKAQEEVVSLGRQLGQEQADHRRDKELSCVEMARIKNVNDALQRHHDNDVKRLQAEQRQLIQDHQQHLENVQKASDATSQDHQRQLEHVQKASETNADRIRKRTEAEIADLQAKISKLEADLTKANISIDHTTRFISDILQANKDHIQDLQTAHLEYQSNSTEQVARLQRAEEKAKDLEARADSATESAKKVAASLAEKEQEKQAVQSELDDLLMVFGDMEDKVKQYRDRLKALGESVSDGEDEDDADEDEDDAGVD
ncbi:related to transport protein USO1 [Rhynchosporium graminicola]|uniref:Related to transport protein USO1 n=1 Tax=Rhynchosporium graminicola TaxID=2792576 RepID=A0A1E1KDC0_9HELO|nr:related to transport protein USO1 [Rhynchosporium commune]